MTKDPRLPLGVKSLLDEAVVIVPYEVTIGNRTERREVRKPLLQFWDELKRAVDKKGDEPA